MYFFFLYIEGKENILISMPSFFNLFLIDIYTPSCYYIIVPREQREKQKHVYAARAAGRRIIMKKYCVKCGKQFEAVGREVICPSCREAAAEESKRAAVERAKRASWTGESVPVRISGRASTLIRRYGAANGLPFAQALDALLQSTAFFKGLGVEWEDITPYRSRRRDKHATETVQDVQDVQGSTQAASTPQEAQAAKQAGKATMSKPQAAKKVAGKAGKKA